MTSCKPEEGQAGVGGFQHTQWEKVGWWLEAQQSQELFVGLLCEGEFYFGF